VDFSKSGTTGKMGFRPMGPTIVRVCYGTVKLTVVGTS
jgi:hypothetical protein